ncbi:hypothetical protein LGQ02_10010 [Bacillus shivajii]|uniref:hypothetical protein n=1 Tax=Bacillus shivajii TaxID=1983719 RepID=UPI001CFC2CD0|nr:hypothetical protein [Bacillus shivajii]UCZ55027.1 hypothetical protein LGQ02_10010 [Bacillus shivajii]
MKKFRSQFTLILQNPVMSLMVFTLILLVIVVLYNEFYSFGKRTGEWLYLIINK